MYKYIPLVVALLFFAACAKKSDRFEVSGTISNAPTGQLICLEHLSYDNTAPFIADSVKISPTGTYQLKATASEEGLYIISIDHNPAILFINDADKIHINFDLFSLRKPAITGSESTAEIYQFINSYSPKDSILKLISYQLDTLAKHQPLDTIAFVALQKQGMEQVTAIAAEMKNKIRTATSPALICYAIDMSKNFVDPIELSKLVDSAAARFKNHKGLQIFKERAAVAAKEAKRKADPVANYQLMNKPAPELTLNDVTGKPVSLSSFKGKYVLVDFWASWCAPCRQENPNVVAAFQQFKDKNFTILGVSLDEDKALWQQAIQKDGLAWTQISDLKQWQSVAPNLFQFDGIPFNVLIDPKGTIIANSLRGPDLQKKLAEVLK